jgi:hypothetical protein
MRIGLAAAAVGILAVAGILYVRRPHIEAHSAAAAQVRQASADPRIAQLSRQIDELRRNLSALEASRRSPQSGPTGAASVPSGDVQVAAADVDAQRAQDAQRRRKYMSGVAQAFADEKVDPAWATGVARRIADAFESDEYLRDRLHNVECRSQTCRMQIDEDEINKISARMPLVTLGLVDVLPSMSAEHTDADSGHRTMTIYMSSQRVTSRSTQK